MPGTAVPRGAFAFMWLVPAVRSVDSESVCIVSTQLNDGVYSFRIDFV